MRNFYHRLFVLGLAAMLFGMDAAGQGNILLVGRDGLGDYQSDQDINDSLVAWGYTPDFWDSNGEYQPGVGLNYDSYDAMVISETVDSKAMARFGTTDGYPLPCINMEGYCVSNTSDRWAWLEDATAELLQTAGGSGTADDQVIVIKDNSHYITEMFQVGDEVPWAANDVASDILANGPVSIKEVNVDYTNKLAQMKSHQSQADFWNLVTIDDIESTGNRMVYWGLNHIALNGEAQTGSYGTPEFFMLLKRSVEWIMGGGGGTAVEEFKARTFELVAFPNPATDQLTVRFRSVDAGMATATLFNMAGQQVDIFQKNTVNGNNFMYLDAGKYVSGMYHLKLEIGEVSSMTKVVFR